MMPLSDHVQQPADGSRLQPSKPRRAHSVRHYLVLMALAIAIPLVGLAFYASSRVATAERESIRMALLSTARSLAAAIDQEIDKHIVVASALAQSRSLAQGNWAEFRELARRALADLPDSSLIVLDPTGRWRASARCWAAGSRHD